MASQKKQDIVPAGPAQQTLQPHEIIAVQIASIVKRTPMLRYVRGEGRSRELRAMKLVLDPGIDAARRDGWRATVMDWWVDAGEMENQESGEIEIVPTLAMMASNGEVCRLSGLPVIRAWTRLCSVVTPDILADGVPVRVRRRQSQTVGRSYWSIDIDLERQPREPGAEG